ASPLSGIVTFTPSSRPARISSTMAPRPPPRTRRAVYSPSRPARRRASVWITGDRDCAMGSPTTAKRSIGWVEQLREDAVATRLLDVALVLVEGGGEGMAAVDVLEDVKEELGLGRGRRRFERCPTGRRDRCRRETVVP